MVRAISFNLSLMRIWKCANKKANENFWNELAREKFPTGLEKLRHT